MSLRRRRAAQVFGVVFLALALPMVLRHLFGARDPSPHQSGRVIAQGVPVDYLDWGGEPPGGG